MANRTDPLATTIHGTNPQFLISKIIRSKIHYSQYWKEICFGLTAESLIDKAVKLRCIGGTYGGNKKPTHFLCLVLKLLQIQPDKEVVIEYIKQDDYKYLRAIGAFYLRLTASSVDIYSYFEPLLMDYRKLRYMNPDGRTRIIRLDEYIDDVLRRENYLDIDLPGLTVRHVLEDIKLIGPKISVLDVDLEFADEELMDEPAREDLPKDTPIENHINEVEESSAADNRRIAPVNDKRHDRRKASLRSRSRSRSNDKHRRRRKRSISLTPERQKHPPIRRRNDSRERHVRRRRSYSRSPIRRRCHSRSPIRRRSHSRSPIRRRSRSRSPPRRRSYSRTPRHHGRRRRSSSIPSKRRSSDNRRL